MMKKIFILSLLLSSAMTMAMERDPNQSSQPGKSSAVLSSNEMKSLTWEERFAGRFLNLDQTELQKRKKFANSLFKTDQDAAFSVYEKLADAGDAYSMFQCCLIYINRAITFSAQDNNKKLKGKKEAQRKHQNLVKLDSLLQESYHWLVLAFSKTVFKNSERNFDDIKSWLEKLDGKLDKITLKPSSGYKEKVEEHKQRLGCVESFLDRPDIILRDIGISCLCGLGVLTMNFSDEIVINYFSWLASHLKDEEKSFFGQVLWTNAFAKVKTFSFTPGDKCPTFPLKPIFLRRLIKTMITDLGSVNNKIFVADQLKSGENFHPDDQEDMDRMAEEILSDPAVINHPQAKSILGFLILTRRARKDLDAAQAYVLAASYFKDPEVFNPSREARVNYTSTLFTGEVETHIPEKERYAIAEQILLSDFCKDEPMAKHNYLLMCLLGWDSNLLIEDEKEKLYQEVLAFSPDFIQEQFVEMKNLQKLKNLKSVQNGALEDSLSQRHQHELMSGEASELTEKIAEAIQDQSLEDEGEDVQSSDSLEETAVENSVETDKAQDVALVEMPSSSNQPAVFVESQKEDAKTASKTNPTKKDKQAQKERKRQAMVAEIQKLASEEQQKLMRKVMSMSFNHGNATEAPQQERQIIFASPEVEAEYQAMLANDKQGKKLTEIIKDILFYGHRLEGMGKPEILTSGNYKGCWSRRINGKDRIVYRVEGDVIKIFEAEGHYQKS